jgi:predicted Zn-dependent protease
MSPQSQLKQAAEALRGGKTADARRILDELVKREPNNAEAWQALFSVLEDPLEKNNCLKQVVRIQPQNAAARQKLHKYQAGSEYRDARTGIRSAALLEEEKKRKARKRKEGVQDFLASMREAQQNLITTRRGGLRATLRGWLDSIRRLKRR